jgi:hypothetical protein
MIFRDQGVSVLASKFASEKLEIEQCDIKLKKHELEVSNHL